MTSGPIATFGIMFIVTNRGSRISATARDQVKISASATPTTAPSAKPPRISTAVTRRLEIQAYLAKASVESAASGEGRMNFGTWKASTRICHSTITARCTIRMIATDFTDRCPSAGNAGFLRAGPSLARGRAGFNHLVDYVRRGHLVIASEAKQSI